jgi:hypothetical protein
MLEYDADPDKKPLYSIIFVNLIMCLYAIIVTVLNMSLLGRAVFCSLWGCLFIFATLNQGRVHRYPWTTWGDRILAVTIMSLYVYFYPTMEWWHYVWGIVAIGLLSTTTWLKPQFTVQQYVWTVNLWHGMVMALVYFVPNQLEERI